MSIFRSAYGLSHEQIKERCDAANAAVNAEVERMGAELRKPKSFTGIPPWSTAMMTVVQQDAGPNWILVSHDGNPRNAKRLPLTYLKGPKAGQPIVRVLHTTIEFKSMPPELGFSLISVAGWIASDRELCQAFNPQLSEGVEWSDAQRKAWSALTAQYHRVLDNNEKTKKAVIREREYRARRAIARESGQYTVTELARGVR